MERITVVLSLDILQVFFFAVCMFSVVPLSCLLLLKTCEKRAKQDLDWASVSIIVFNFLQQQLYTS